MWQSQIELGRFSRMIRAIGLLLLLAGVLLNYVSIFLTGVVCIGLFYVNRETLKKRKDTLQLVNEKETHTFFIEQEGELLFRLTNKGDPLAHATLTVQIDDVLMPLSVFSKQGHQYVIRCNIHVGQGETVVRVPFRAAKRGVAHIKSLTLTCPSFFGFGYVALTYRPYIKMEYVVYPITEDLASKFANRSWTMGEDWVKQSLYHDRFLLDGVRDYQHTDSFRQINWSATLRAQSWQVNTYQAVDEQGWHISMNLYQLSSGKLEQYISGVSGLLYQLTEANIPFSLLINMRTTGNSPFLLLPEGKGLAHLRCALEILATIGTHPIVYPYEELVAYYHLHMKKQPNVLHIGADKQTWWHRGHSSLLLELTNDNTMSVVPF